MLDKIQYCQSVYLFIATLALLPAYSRAESQPGELTIPIVVDGETQIVPEFKDPDLWIRHDLWVETEFDSDGDAKPDRMHVDVTRPRQADSLGLKLPVIYISSPYFGGTGDKGREFFWDLRHDLAPLKAAVLMAHAFNDWNVVPEHSNRIFQALKARGVPTKVYYHQGGHGGGPPNKMMNRWFAHYLHGVENGVEKGPRAWIVRENAERTKPTPYEDCPNPAAAPVAFHLIAGSPERGRLVAKKPPEQGVETLADTGYRINRRSGRNLCHLAPGRWCRGIFEGCSERSKVSLQDSSNGDPWPVSQERSTRII